MRETAVGFALLVLGFTLGFGIAHANRPDPLTLQNFASEVAYIAGRVDQANRPDDDSAIVDDVACRTFKEDGLSTIPSDYQPQDLYKGLITLCQPR